MIGIILGSDSDMPRIKNCFTILKDVGVPFEVVISSAHRTPEQTSEWAASAKGRGVKVIIAAAGGAAHLPGIVAAYTTLPVIGVPVETHMAGGFDSLLSISQMPSGIPVAAMSVGKAGGANAALFALEILAVGDASLADKLELLRREEREQIEIKNSRLKAYGWEKYIEELETKNDAHL